MNTLLCIRQTSFSTCLDFMLFLTSLSVITCLSASLCILLLVHSLVFALCSSVVHKWLLCCISSQPKFISLRILSMVKEFNMSCRLYIANATACCEETCILVCFRNDSSIVSCTWHAVSGLSGVFQDCLGSSWHCYTGVQHCPLDSPECLLNQSIDSHSM